MTDDPPRPCSSCQRVRYDVRRRLPLPGQPNLCDRCFNHAMKSRLANMAEDPTA